MAYKLNELHTLMTKSGLAESAQILRTSFGVQPQKAGKTPVSDNTQLNAMANHNNNKNCYNRVLDVSNSEETIYTKAIKGRGSSSSEEINTSDECINPLGEVNVTPTPGNNPCHFVEGERRASQERSVSHGHPRECDRGPEASTSRSRQM